MTWIWLISLALIVPILYLILTKKKRIKIEEPNFIHIFPDYRREDPYIAGPGERISFIVKGYKDKECIEEVELIEADIIWQHQNYIGKIGYRRGRDEIDYSVPSDQGKKGKTIYIAVTYHKKKDATWIKIAE